MKKKVLCDDCLYFFKIKELHIGICANVHSDYSQHVLTRSHLSCKFFCDKNKKLNVVRSVIIYGGTKKQIEKQLSCDHFFHGPCIDKTSRYHKCKKCFCILRNMTEEEYYKEMGLEDMIDV